MYEDILAKKNWAVAGASEDSLKFGHKIYKKLKEKGYNAYPLNPGVQEVLGDKCYAKLADIPVKPDVVNVVVPPKAAIEVAKQAAEAGIEYIWFQPGANKPEVVEEAKKLGLKVIADACVLVELRKPMFCKMQ